MFSDPSKGIFGLSVGKNQFGVQFRILAKLSESLPILFLVQSVD